MLCILLKYRPTFKNIHHLFDRLEKAGIHQAGAAAGARSGHTRDAAVIPRGWRVPVTDHDRRSPTLARARGWQTRDTARPAFPVAGTSPSRVTTGGRRPQRERGQGRCGTRPEVPVAGACPSRAKTGGLRRRAPQAAHAARSRDAACNTITATKRCRQRTYGRILHLTTATAEATMLCMSNRRIASRSSMTRISLPSSPTCADF